MLARFLIGYGLASLLVSIVYVLLCIRHARRKQPTIKPGYAERQAEQIIMRML